MNHLRVTIPVLIAVTFGAPASHAEDRATAQQLFDQGKALMNADKVAEACPKFEAAAQLSQTAGVRLNLAGCWARLGRTASAWAGYDEALALAERAGDKNAVDLARNARAELEPKLCYLTVTVAHEAAAADLEVLRDGRRLPAAAWGMPVPVDPGEHEIAATAPGRRSWSTKRAVTGEGTKVIVEVPPLAKEQNPVVAGALAPAPSASAPPPAPMSALLPAPGPHEASVETSPGAGQRTLSLVAGGLGVVGVGVGSYFGLRARSKRNDYESHRGSDGACLDMDCQTLSHDAHSAGNVSTAAFAASGALLAAGVVLWLTAPHGTRKETSARIVPVAHAHVMGLGLSGSW
jgi:hypothetical protein